MVINEQILESSGATTEEYQAREMIFSEDHIPEYYYQIIEGRVKLNNYNYEGKEILQTILEPGESIGESVLFVDNHTYPVNAVAATRCTVLRLRKTAFFEILERNPAVSMKFNRHLSKILYFKHVMGQILCTQSPTFKILALLDLFKKSQTIRDSFTYQLPLTRQEIADMTGLCVETAIRTVKKMEKLNIVKIDNRKIYY